MSPIDDYLNELKLLGRSLSYIRHETTILKKFQKFCNGKDLLQIDDNTILSLIQEMRDQRYTNQSITKYIKGIDRFYSFMVESQKYGLTANPVKRISKKLNHKKIQTRRPIKTIDDITKFIKCIHNPRDRAVVVLLSKTAIRNGELIALELEDIDFEKEILNIDKHIDDHSNTVIKGRKNENETSIPLDEETIRALRFYLMVRPIVKPKDGSNPLFLSHNGYRLNTTDVARIVKEWSIKTGIGVDSNETSKKVVPHFFRAWSTYQLQINGCNPAVIDYIRGDTASTIRGFYVNQVLPFEVIRKEYLKAVPKFGI